MRRVMWISCILAALFCRGAANASTMTLTIKQVGPNVVATGSGTLDLTGLSLNFTANNSFPGMGPSNTVLAVGHSGPASIEYFSVISGPSILTGGFGPGAPAAATTGTGDRFGVSYAVGGPYPNPPSAIIVPAGYVSGTFLSGTATWDNTTLAALGVTPGTYTWTWGTGRTQNSLGLSIPAPTVIPEPGTLGMLGTGLIGLAGMARRKLKLGT